MNKKWLYFTRSDGQVDSMPNNPKLDNSEKRREFIGDQESYRFSVQDGCGKHPVWNGSKYISDPEMLKLDVKKKASDLYNEIENHFYIEANGRVYNFDISKKIDFFAKFVMMPEDGALLWTAHDNEEYSHTKEEALNVFIAAEAFLKPLFDAKKADKAGDGSLSNLNAIKAAQEALK